MDNLDYLNKVPSLRNATRRFEEFGRQIRELVAERQQINIKIGLINNHLNDIA
jgi:hypothetical protein